MRSSVTSPVLVALLICAPDRVSAGPGRHDDPAICPQTHQYSSNGGWGPSNGEHQTAVALLQTNLQMDVLMATVASDDAALIPGGLQLATQRRTNTLLTSTQQAGEAIGAGKSVSEREGILLHDAPRRSGQQGCSQVGPEGPPRNTSCPLTKWVGEMVRTDPSPGKTIVNIGCNKGNDAVRWMELWDMSATHFWSQENWNQQLSKQQIGTQIGTPDAFACKPEQDYVTASSIVKGQASDQAVPTGVCVEPMLSNVRVLKEASQALGYSTNTPYGSFHIVQAAVVGEASPNETVLFPNLAAGAETGHLNDADPQNAHTQVPVKTVDTIMESLGLHRADILSIDTEGYDAEVLRGAKLTLANVRYVEFEVHRDLAPWSSTSLKSVANDLDQQGFDCFWAGNNGKLTNIKKCWSDDFENGMWANAACVKRGDIWSGALQQFSV